MIRIKTTKATRVNRTCLTSVCTIEWNENCEADVNDKDAKLLEEKFEDISIVGKAKETKKKEEIPTEEELEMKEEEKVEKKEETPEETPEEKEEGSEVDKEIQEKIAGLETLAFSELKELAKEIDEKGEWQKMRATKQLVKYIIDNS